MAKYKMDEKKFIKNYLAQNKKIKINSIRLISFIIFLSLSCLYLWKKEEYILVILGMLFFLTFVFVYIGSPKRTARTQYRTNHLFGEEIDIQFNDVNIDVSINGNSLSLSVSDIKYIFSSTEIIHIQHNVGLYLFIPVSSLSTLEKKQIGAYQQAS